MPCFGCGAFQTIRAHIIPRGFARDALDGDKHLYAVTRTEFRYSQSGYWDSEILCETCDGKLGRFDDYALEATRKLTAIRLIPGKQIELPFSGPMLSCFVNAVIWRASISRRLRNINLGRYNDGVRDALLRGGTTEGLLPAHAYPYYVAEFKAAGVYSYPVSFRFGNGWRGFSFLLGGVRWVALADRRIPATLRQSCMTDLKRVKTRVLNLKDMTELESMKEVTDLHGQRPY